MRWLESPDLSAALIAFFAMLGTILGGGTVTQMLNRKKNPANPPPEFAEVKGALISDKAAERVIQSSDAFTAAATMLKTAIDRDVEAKNALTKALTENSRSLDRNSDVAEDIHEGTKSVSTRLERLEVELIRSQRGGDK